MGLAAVRSAEALKAPSEAPVEQRLAVWEERNQQAVLRCRKVLHELASGANIDCVMRSVALRELRLRSARMAPEIKALDSYKDLMNGLVALCKLGTLAAPVWGARFMTCRVPE